eukprot:gene45825-biopygen48304
MPVCTPEGDARTLARSAFRMSILCSDKTGTQRGFPIPFGLSSNSDNLEDPIDSGVLRACVDHFEKTADPWDQLRRRYVTKRFIGFDPSTKRVWANDPNLERGSVCS